MIKGKMVSVDVVKQAFYNIIYNICVYTMCASTEFRIVKLKENPAIGL